MAENVTINSDLVLKAHKDGSASDKKLLEKLHPNLFKNEDYKKIDSLKAALKWHGLTEADAKVSVGKKMQHRLNEIQNGVHLDLIAAAIRNGREVNPEDPSQAKWFPVFKYVVPSGFGFSYTIYGDSNSTTSVGSRRKFLTSEEAEWFGRQFIDLHHIDQGKKAIARKSTKK